jgi:hypothetical protein
MQLTFLFLFTREPQPVAGFGLLESSCGILPARKARGKLRSCDAKACLWPAAAAAVATIDVAPAL